MAANSKHWADVLEWLYKIIDSCVTVQQILATKRLVRLYIEKYPYEKWENTKYIAGECLMDYCDTKLSSLSRESINS